MCKTYFNNLQIPLEDTMSKILEELEDIGMLPPTDESSQEYWAKKWGYKSFKDLVEAENSTYTEGEQPPISKYEYWCRKWEEE